MVSRGQHIVISYVVILLYGKKEGSLPEKLTHVNDLSIRSFDCMVSRSFHTQLLFDFSSNVTSPFNNARVCSPYINIASLCLKIFLCK